MRNWLRIVLFSVALVGCDAGSGGGSDPQVSSVVPPGTAYATEVGTIYVKVPPNYVAVRSASPQFYDRFQRQLPNLRLLDVYVTREDFARAGNADEIMQGQVVQLQLFPAGSPPLTPKMWEQLKSSLPSMLSGTAGEARIASAEREVLRAARENPDLPQVTSLSTGEVIVYHSDEESVRWATVGTIQLANAQPSEVIVVSAARRIGAYPFLVQSVLPKKQSADVPKAIGALNDWLTHISVAPATVP